MAKKGQESQFSRKSILCQGLSLGILATWGCFFYVKRQRDRQIPSIDATVGFVTNKPNR